jgi:hypothetical protein
LRIVPNGSDAVLVDEPIIYREEVVGLPFSVNDIVRLLTRITQLLGGDDGEEEADTG